MSWPVRALLVVGALTYFASGEDAEPARRPVRPADEPARFSEGLLEGLVREQAKVELRRLVPAVAPEDRRPDRRGSSVAAARDGAASVAPREARRPSP